MASPPPGETTIVVTGRRIKESDGSYRLQFSTEIGTPGASFVSPREVSENGDSSEPELIVSVAIEQTDSRTDRAKLEEAARKVVETLVRLISAAEVSDLSRVIYVLNQQVTIGEVLDRLLGVEWTVTDRSDFGNPGVGGANAATGTVATNWAAIIGGTDLNGRTYSGWANFPGGMNAIILHDIMHLTPAGAGFASRSVEVHSSDPIWKWTPFYNTPYGPNNEAFADDLMQPAATLLGIDTGGLRPSGQAQSRLPEDIYQTTNGVPYPGP